MDESALSLPEDRLPFTLSQLAALLTVARTGSVTSAALALSISQPAVSKSLSGLEQVSRLDRRVDAGLDAQAALHSNTCFASSDKGTVPA